MISGVILRKPPDRATPLRGGPLIMYISKKADGPFPDRPSTGQSSQKRSAWYTGAASSIHAATWSV